MRQLPQDERVERLKISSLSVQVFTLHEHFREVYKKHGQKFADAFDVDTVDLGCGLDFAIHVADFLHQLLLWILTVLQELPHDVLIDLKNVVGILAVKVPQIVHLLLDVDRDAANADCLLLIVSVGVLSPVPELFIRDVLEFALEQVGRAVEDV